MKLAGVPQNEHERLTALYAYHILDTLPERDFDDITTLAAEICGTTLSAISIIDKERQWLKSMFGNMDQETPRDVAFCSHAILNPNEILVVPNSREDERFSENPYSIGEPPIIFYAGVPLCTEDGLALGTLCVIDHIPKTLTNSQLKSLRALGNQVVAQLELRKKNRELMLNKFALQEINEELERFARVVAHDLKSPCNNIIGLSEILLSDSKNQLSDEGKEIVNYMSDAALQLKHLVDDILSHSRTLNFSDDTIKHFTFAQLIGDLHPMIQIPSKFNLQTHGSNNAVIITAKSALLQILSNLCTNAIRYNDKDHCFVTISFTEETDQYTFTVADNGMGIHPDNLDKIFENSFTTLTDKDRFNTAGHGIGLATVKRLINKLGGEISVTSKVGEGATFVFTIAK